MPPPADLTPEQGAAVQEMIAAQLKDIKSKLNSAYGERDAALEKLKAATDAIDAAKVEALKREGKELEAMKLQLEATEAKAKAAEERAVKLARDSMLQSALSNTDFASERARKMAFNQLVGTLVQDSKGEWTHASGKPIEAAVEDFAKDPDNAFLLKTKQSSGSGSSGGSRKTPPDTRKLSQMSNEELVKRAREKAQ